MVYIHYHASDDKEYIKFLVGMSDVYPSYQPSRGRIYTFEVIMPLVAIAK